MDFTLTSEQVLLKDTVRRLLEGNYRPEQRREFARSLDGCSREMWGRYGELGLLGLTIPESMGGVGGGAAELMVTMHEFGRALVLEPFVETIVVCGGLLVRLGRSEQHRHSISRLASGQLFASFACDDDPRSPVSAVPFDGGWKFRGRKLFVPSAELADELVVAAVVNGMTHLFVVQRNAPGLKVTESTLLDGHRSATVTFEDVQIAAGGLLSAAADEDIRAVNDAATAALCAEAVGAMEAVVDLTVEYVRQRHQFGVPISSFQAVRHRIADMKIELELARSMAILATVDADSNCSHIRAKSISAAKIFVSRAGREIGQAAVQLHGAVGMTDEYRVGHLFMRLEAIGKTFGTAEEHVERLAECGGALE